MHRKEVFSHKGEKKEEQTALPCAELHQLAPIALTKSTYEPVRRFFNLLPNSIGRCVLNSAIHLLPNFHSSCALYHICCKSQHFFSKSICKTHIWKNHTPPIVTLRISKLDDQGLIFAATQNQIVIGASGDFFARDKAV